MSKQRLLKEFSAIGFAVEEGGRQGVVKMSLRPHWLHPPTNLKLADDVGVMLWLRLFGKHIALRAREYSRTVSRVHHKAAPRLLRVNWVGGCGAL